MKHHLKVMREQFYIVGDGIGWLARWVRRSPFEWLAVVLLIAVLSDPASAEIIGVGVVEAGRQCGDDFYPILERASESGLVWICGDR